MAHFAKIDNQTNIVLEVNVVDNENIENLPFPNSESLGIEFLIPWNTPDTYWKQTSYNGNFRKNYAGVGFTYDSNLDAFISPQPYPSWLLDAQICDWVAPVSYPNDGKLYDWNESTLTWDLSNEQL
jgi:hypothetical protein